MDTVAGWSGPVAAVAIAFLTPLALLGLIRVGAVVCPSPRGFALVSALLGTVAAVWVLVVTAGLLVAAMFEFDTSEHPRNPVSGYTLLLAALGNLVIAAIAAWYFIRSAVRSRRAGNSVVSV